MALPKLPENPTPEQLKAIALAVIRTTFEDDAENIGDIEPLDEGGGGWKTTYEAGFNANGAGYEYAIEYTKRDGFGKMPLRPVQKRIYRVGGASPTK